MNYKGDATKVTVVKVNEHRYDLHIPFPGLLADPSVAAGDLTDANSQAWGAIAKLWEETCNLPDPQAWQPLAFRRSDSYRLADSAIVVTYGPIG